jgi:hypothetical protein
MQLVGQREHQIVDREIQEFGQVLVLNGTLHRVKLKERLITGLANDGN